MRPIYQSFKTFFTKWGNPLLKTSLTIAGTLLFASIAHAQIQFVYTSDAHYGITRTRFQRAANVNSTVVHAAMINKMNTLPSLILPTDGGVNQGLKISTVDYVMMTGDIANRQETPIQSASASWSQFVTNYINGLTLKNKANQNSKLYLLPGNHDVSNAIGYYKAMTPLKDSAAMTNIYILMMPSPRPTGAYNYANEKIHYSKNMGGVHFMFVCMWPDSAERVWMAADLANVSPTTPVFIFTHDQPNIETKHLTNPNGTHNINSTNKFENLVLERFKGGTTITAPSTIEQRGFANFVKSHPNIVAYFHGNDNQNNYYTYTGPDNNILLNIFQVDSPMKGNISATDETKLSFQFFSMDTLAKVLTVRECLWNTDTMNAAAPIVFGASKTISYDVNKLASSKIQFIYTSDAHYGINRARFQRNANVNATVVHAAMINKMNNLSTATFPKDGGVNEGLSVAGIDYVMMTGDIANRQETPIQSATASWGQFATNYISGLTIKNNANQKAKLFLSPGNHDVSNAIGFYKAMTPLKDSAAMTNIYNLMMPTSRPAGAYNYANEKIHYSKNIGGIHFMFVCMWPDSAERVWMATDLATVSPTTPVFIFTHDQPNIETKHLTNPNGIHNINSTNKFENLVLERFKGGTTITAPSTIEQRGFANFVKAHKNIVAYFHGNDNQNSYYTYTGPDNNLVLNVFQVDSPMKGNISATDETKLSFQCFAIDTVAKVLTVRECLYDADTMNANSAIVFGATKTISIVVDSIIQKANSLVESNYSIPSWTLFRKAYVTAINSASAANISSLGTAIKKLVSKNSPYSVCMNFNGNPSSSLGFSWFTNSGITTGSVQLFEGVVDSTGFGSATTITASATAISNTNYNVASNQLWKLAGIADNSKKSFVSHKAVASGLKPNTTYSYRVGSAGYYSEVGKFTTAKNTKDPFSFIYFTDPQANTDAMFDISQKTTHAAVNKYPNANFMLTCGDLVETSGSNNSEWEYEQFFASQQDIWYNKPFAPLMGNHDFSANKNFTNHFNTANPSFNKTMCTTPGSVYSFVYGDALFMALSYEDYAVAGYLDSLSIWMKQQVAANPNVKWRIAFLHKTMFTGSSSHQSDADGKIVRDKMAPLFDTLKIDFAMEGHDHVYEVIGPINNKQLVANAVSNQATVTRTVRDNVTGKLGGTFDVKNGTLYFLNNSGGKKKYEPRDSVAMKNAEGTLGITNYFGLFSGRFGQTGEPTFSNITVSTDSIRISTFTVSDLGVATLFDSYKIIKSANVSSVLISPKTLVLEKTASSLLTATVLPANATSKSVTWLSTDPTIADVVNGTVTAKKIGVVSIVVKTVDGGKTDTCKVTVTSIAVTNVVIPDETKNILKGTTFSTTAIVIPTNADNKTVTWSSTDPTIADVVNGTITAYKVGKVSIVAKTADGNKTDTCKVTVTPILVTSIAISDKNISIKNGSTFSLSATVSPSSADNQNVTWSSSDASIADVVNGTITAKKEGVVSITVKTVDGSSKTDVCNVTVTSSTSINNIELQNSITLMPNPTIGALKIQSADNNKISYVEIINSKGQFVISKEANSSIVDLDLSMVKKGKYIIIVYTKNGTISKQIVRL